MLLINYNKPIQKRRKKQVIRNLGSTTIPIFHITKEEWAVLGLLAIGTYFLLGSKPQIKQIPYIPSISFDGLRDVQAKYKDKINEYTFNQLVNISKSVNENKPYKYLDWLVKIYIENASAPDIFEKLREYISSFDYYVNKGIIKNKETDIYHYKTLQELINKIKGVRCTLSKREIRKKKTYGEGLIEGRDFKKVYEDNKYRIITPLTYEASCFFGKNTKWCVSMHNEPMHWKSYTELGIKFYFVIDNNIQSGDYGYAIYAVSVYPQYNINLPPVMEIYNKEDQLIEKKEFFRDTNLNHKFFINQVTKEEYLNLIVDGTYSYNADGSIDVEGSVDLSRAGYTQIPFKFNTVTVNFDCSNNQLTTLQGVPEKVGGNFDCSHNQLITLQGAPEKVGGSFYCSYNQLTTLQGAPEKVGGSFYCSHNQLTTLQGAPEKVGGSFYCSYNQLTTLQGAPEKVGGNFYCSNNQLTTLQGAPEKVEDTFNCSNNQLITLQGAPENVGDTFNCSYNQLITLQGAPENVGDNFNCSYNQLITLQGAPENVGGSFYCYSNQLTTLQGAPENVGGSFNCSYNQLITLQGAPENVGGSFNCSYNQLTTLQGAPENVGGNLNCSNNKKQFMVE